MILKFFYITLFDYNKVDCGRDTEVNKVPDIFVYYQGMRRGQTLTL